MALDVYFRFEIAHALTAVAVGMISASVANGADNIEYIRGMLETTRANAEAFGIEWSPIVAKLRETRQADVLALLPGG